MKKVILSLCIIAVAFSAQATIRRVNNNPFINGGVNNNTFYTTLTAAYNAAGVGDTLIVEPSPTSYGPLTLTKRLAILGNGYNGSNGQMINNNSSTIDLINCNAGSAGSYFSGLRLPSSSSINVSDVTFKRCWFGNIDFSTGGINCKILQSYMSGYLGISSHTNILIQNSIIGSVSSNLSSPVIENCYIASTVNFSNGVGSLKNCILGSPPVQLLNATLSHNVCIGCTISCPNCISNALATDVFVTATGNYETDRILQTVTPNPALNAGAYGNGDDIGVFSDGVGRPTYKIGGVTSTPSISSFQLGAMSNNTINATISTKGNN